ncbi:SDR family oxidoreductase [Streptomyces tardus]|uniref:SDR family oxidoreductase n=1 Tax=Streptomyces tardus TaxID=2780544 RepID=UPI001F02FBA4|nr:SDR family oxidoreductase [Streptomyces tardus]
MPRSHVKDLTGRNVFVTGAASGIGRATALLAAERGARLHLTDIQADRLLEVAEEIIARGGRVPFAEPADLADCAAVRDLAVRLTSRHGSMDVVMNIAGVSTWGTVSSLEHHHWRRMVDVNLMGPIHIIEYLLPAMIDGGRGGHLVNVSSSAGLLGLPWHAAYSAAKFGLRGVSEVLRFDLRRHRIGVSLVCPGAVDTPLTETVDIVGADASTPAFRRLQARFRSRAARPEDVAEAILEGIRTGRYLVHTSREIRLLHFLQRVLPPVYELVMRLLNGLAHRALPAVAEARASTARTPQGPPAERAAEPEGPALRTGKADR